MTTFTRTTAGLALLAFALAPSVQAQEARSDQDEPTGSPIRLEVSTPEAPGADQDIPGTRNTVRQEASRSRSDRDDVTRPLAPPSTEAPMQRLDMGRDVTATVMLGLVVENEYPDGRDLPPVALKVADAGPRTMTEDGRPLGTRPGTPVTDETEVSPEAPLAKIGDAEVADSPLLSPSSPNPVVRSARIAFTLPHEASASLTLFDVRGREVATLFDGAARAGTTTVSLDASSLAAGTYVYVLDVDGARVSRRLQVVR